MTLLLVGLGGAIGTLLRHGLSLWLNDPAAAPGVIGPHAGTLVANALGSLLLVLVAELATGQVLLGTDLRLVLGTGMMGGFTTYSTFNLETYRMLQQGDAARAALYMLATLSTCLLAAALGMQLARMIRT